MKMNEVQLKLSDELNYDQKEAAETMLPQMTVGYCTFLCSTSI